MKRLIVAGVLVFGLASLGWASSKANGQNGNGQGQNGNGQGQNGNGQGDNGNGGNRVQMPEGPAFELPYLLVLGASCGLWRRYSRNRKSIHSGKA